MPASRRDPRFSACWLAVVLLCAGATLATADVPPAYQLKWGGLGTAPGLMNLPCELHATASRVYVVDGDNHRIQVFDKDGGFLFMWGSNGPGDGQFIYPTGIAVDDSGYVYVGDTNNHRVQKFTSEGQYVLQFGTHGFGPGQFNFCAGVAVDRSGRVIVCDYLGDKLEVFTKYGAHLASWGSTGPGPVQFYSPYGIDTDGDGNIYIADKYNHRIQKLAPDGSFILQWGSYGTADGQFDEPQNPAWDGAEAIYVVDKYNDQVQKFTRDGVFLARWGSTGTGTGQFNNPEGITSDHAGYVYIGDWLNHRVERFGYATDDAPVSPAGRGPLALETVTPNPARGSLRVRFTLAGDAPATLTLHDLAGRAMTVRPLAGSGAGPHELTLPLDAALPAGIYFVRVTQGAAARAARVAVVR